jgi:hypothetical protein
VLKATEKQPIGPVIISVLAHVYDADILLVMLHIVFPGFEGLNPPALITAAKISKTGAVVADVALRDGTIVRDAVIFRDEMEMQSEFRRLADSMKLDDADRKELFACALKWVVADRRLDPTFDPKDPDAKRLTVH